MSTNPEPTRLRAAENAFEAAILDEVAALEEPREAADRRHTAH